jgi:hypothetical protein
MKKATRGELVKAIRSAVSMLKNVGFDYDCEPSLKRAWRSSVKQIEATIAAEPKPTRR